MNKTFRKVYTGLSIAYCILGFIIYYFVHQHNNTKLIKSEVGQFEIVGVNPPKHVYIDLKNLTTGEITKKVYVSKHFGDWKSKVFEGRVIKLRINYYLTYGKESVKYDNLYETLKSEP